MDKVDILEQLNSEFLREVREISSIELYKEFSTITSAGTISLG